jgi:glucose-6-phosphate 1-dehydrogenase
MPNPLADELTGTRHARPCALVIFGATGDLTRRKLIPALLGLAHDGLLPPALAVVGFARRPYDDAGFRDNVRDEVVRFTRGEQPPAQFAAFADRVLFHSSNFEDAAGYEGLARRLAEIDRAHGTRGNRLFYLATPPSAYSAILHNLGRAGLSREKPGTFARVIIEKPFGQDLETARALNDQVAASFDERQVYRIDHYLGKETVQNILAMRFANRIFEPLWNEQFVDHVQITVAESIGVGTRGAYFEEAGIVRDMIQSHILQVLTLVAMEPPVSLDADAVRDEKVKVLRAIRDYDVDDVARALVCGQYQGGSMAGEDVRGYLEEDGVAKASRTETYAAMRLEIGNWRWGRTPFFLRSGKRMTRRVTEVAIRFKKPPHHLFERGGRAADPNTLLLRIQPDEGISLRFGSKVPGPALRLRDVRMDFRYGSAFAGQTADAYERLLLDAMIGDSTLFARRDEVEEAWRIVDSLLAGWRALDRAPDPYPAGTWGPAEADRILGEGRQWRRP